MADGNGSPLILSTSEIAVTVGQAIMPEITKLINSSIEKQIGEKIEGRASCIPEVDQIKDGRASDFGTQSIANDDEVSVLSDGEIDPYDQVKRDVTTWKPTSETTDKLNKYLKAALKKDELRNLCEKYPPLGTPVAQIPKVDQSFVQMIHNRGNSLRKLPGLLAIEGVQGRLLHAASPLAALMDLAKDARDKNEGVDPYAVTQGIEYALILLGNANASCIYERQRLVLKAMNPKLQTLATRSVEDPTSTDLFGAQLRKDIRNHVELSKEVSAFERSFNDNGGQARSGKWTNYTPQRGYVRGRSNRFTPYSPRGFSRGGSALPHQNYPRKPFSGPGTSFNKPRN